MPWYVVTGRVEFDDEDSCFVLQALSAEDARAQAEDLLCASDDDGYSAIYINYVVECGAEEPRIVVRGV